MRKWLMCAALIMALGMTMKSAAANPATLPSGHVPVGLKIAVITVGVMTASVMLHAIHVSRTQNRQLTVQEAQLAAFLPFLWVFQPTVAPLVAIQSKRRR